MAQAWFERHAADGWATCPLTENGFVRIASQPSYSNRPGDAQAVLAMLRRMCSLETHQFWPDEISIRDLLPPDTALTPSQLTDVYLLGLAVRNGGKFATFDVRVPAAGIAGGPEALELIAPA